MLSLIQIISGLTNGVALITSGVTMTIATALECAKLLTKKQRVSLVRIRHHVALQLVAVAVVALVSSHPSPVLAQSLPPTLAWERLGNDLERTQFSFNVGALFTSSIVIARSSLTEYRLRTIRASEFGWKRASVKALCKAAGAAVCINSNFFDEQGKALGLVISRGIIHQKLHRGGGVLTGVLLATPKAVRITSRDTFTPAQAVEAIQAGPRLVSDGEPVRGLHDASLSSNLSGACIDKEQRLLIYRVTSGLFGSTIRQLQKLLLDPLLGCVEALNFDGGGSSQLFISSKISGSDPRAEEFLTGEDDVPVAIGLFHEMASTEG
jgi:hypothetical protein